MKKFTIFLIILFLIGIIMRFYYYQNNSNNNSNFNYISKKISASENTLQETNTNYLNLESNSENNLNNNDTLQKSVANEINSQNNTNQSSSEVKKENIETQISEFSTKIYTKDSKRQNNINITCSTLNNTYVNSGETFSFCTTVGKATTSKGYKKADVFKDGEVVKAVGGGNCQVSSTLYNAVLKIPELKVTERHEHSNSVPYVSKGKDAAVATGSYDFKFINNLNSKIKIASSCDKNYVYIKIFKVE